MLAEDDDVLAIATGGGDGDIEDFGIVRVKNYYFYNLLILQFILAGF